jgi:superfamily II DNA or RNA helicase
VPDDEMAYYKGGMKKADLEKAKTKRLVFCTYGMTGEATDVPWWDCAILATPRANVTQAAGRVLREHPGKPKPVIIDIVDDDSAILEGYFKARLKQYTSHEMKGEVIYL